MPTFAANLSILFTEVPFLERFARAAEAGFGAVEFWWPSGEDPGAVERAAKDAGLAVALLNFDAGDMRSGDRGLAGNPAREAQFRENVPVAVALADALGCPRLNALVGLAVPEMDRAEQLEVARDNVAFAAERAATIGADVLIEATNTFDNGSVLLSTTAQALDFVRDVGRDNVRVQYDAYHMQRMEGNLVATLRQHIGSVGHVQIADSPGRGEPGTGEIHYPFVFATLDELGYDGYVGLEYRPTTERTEDSLRWLPHRLRGGHAPVSRLNL